MRIAPSIKDNAAHARLEDFVTLPYPRAVRAAVLRIAEGAYVSTRELSQLNFRVGRVFADAALLACRKFRLNPRRLSLIGSHGQTVFHQGKPDQFLGEAVSSTLQIGEPAVIAARTGVTTVGDFRPADMAVGGQGAPLVPWGDYLLFRDERKGRVILNIGGIANVTIIPKGAKAAVGDGLRYRPRKHDHRWPGAPLHSGRQQLRPRSPHGLARQSPARLAQNSARRTLFPATSTQDRRTRAIRKLLR